MTARASKHSVVAEQWVCAWLRPHTVRVPSRVSARFRKTVRVVAGRKPEAPVRGCGVLLPGCGGSGVGVADRLASGPRRSPTSLRPRVPTPSRFLPGPRGDGRRLLSLLGWLHLIREGHRLLGVRVPSSLARSSALSWVRLLDLPRERSRGRSSGEGLPCRVCRPTTAPCTQALSSERSGDRHLPL
jgi:hypothetical protein